MRARCSVSRSTAKSGGPDRYFVPAKAIIIGTGGSNRQRQLPPHVRSATDRGSIAGLAGMCRGPTRDASGETGGDGRSGAALMGASTNQIGEFGSNVTKTQFSSAANTITATLQWLPERPGLRQGNGPAVLYVRDWQDVICVNMLGPFASYDETGGQYIANNYNSIENYIQGDWRNVQRSKYAPKQLAERGAGLASTTATTAAGRSGRSSDSDAVVA